MSQESLLSTAKVRDNSVVGTIQLKAEVLPKLPLARLASVDVFDVTVSATVAGLILMCDHDVIQEFPLGVKSAATISTRKGIFRDSNHYCVSLIDVPTKLQPYP